MLAKKLHDFRAVLQQEGIMFAYSGYVTEPVLQGVGEALKRHLEIQDADTRTVRSVFAIFVEQMQNMIRHSAERFGPDAESKAPAELRFGVLTIGQEAGSYVVTAGNLGPPGRCRADARPPERASRHGQGSAQGRLQGPAEVGP